MSRNLYATRSREQIVNLLRSERRYLSAAAIHRILRSLGTQVSLSTVYRTLDLLVSMGVASSRTDDEGEQTYVFCTVEHHHHAICRKCGHVEEVDCGAMDAFAAALQRHHAFELDSHSLEFYGRCARCL
ncbi:MAG TPA: transcriptional repressor [Candidatus Binatia bacterium]|nr:transcriptional repressor [Candidatus Binatia bacterium]